MADNSFKIKSGLNLPPSNSAPTSPINGDVYYDNSLNKLSGYENGSFVTAGVSTTTTVNSLDALSEEFVIASGNKVNYFTKTSPNFVKLSWIQGQNFPDTRISPAQFGVQNSCIIATGQLPAWTSLAYGYNGHSFYSVANTGTARKSPCSAGVYSAGIIINGNNSSDVALNTTEHWNSSSWSAGGSTSIVREAGWAIGTRYSTLVSGGYRSNAGNDIRPETEKYNGVTWSSTGSMNAARYSHAGFGIQNSAVVSSGLGAGHVAIVSTEKFNGSIWLAASGGDLPSAQTGISGAGTVTNGLIFANNTSAFSFNGLTYSTASNLNVTRSSPRSGVGTGSKAFVATGQGTDTTEKYIGEVACDFNYVFKGSDSFIEDNESAFVSQEAGYLSVDFTINANPAIYLQDKIDIDLLQRLDQGDGKWTASGNLNTARRLCASAGFQNSMLLAGGTNGTALAITELFNGTTWSTSGNLNTARSHLGGAGIQTGAVSFGGINGGGSYVDNTEKFNGSTWAASGAYPGLLAHVHGCGVVNAALGIGGGTSTPTYQTACYKFNGTTWSVTGSLNTARDRHTAIGMQNSALAISGNNGGGAVLTSEKFNGSVWSFIPTFLGETARVEASGFGTVNSAVIATGADSGGTKRASSEKFNGIIWVASGNLATAKDGCEGQGSGNSGTFTGGRNAGDVAQNATEKYNTEVTVPYTGAVLGKLTSVG